jgi:cytochrome c-type biogenesis protein
MSEPGALGIAVAFAAGLLSFLSPCVLPLVPSYVGFLTGMTLPEMSGRRRIALLHALCFVAGFSLVFILLGASATALGRALNYYQVWIQRVGGVLIIAFGLVCLGVFKVGLLTQEHRVHLERKPDFGSGLVGAAFAAGDSASGRCHHAATSADLTRGMLLLGVYSAGLAVPFLVAAVAVESFLDWFQRFQRFLPWVMRLSGALLIFVGILLVSGEFTRLAGWLQGFTPEFLSSRSDPAATPQRPHIHTKSITHICS